MQNAQPSPNQRPFVAEYPLDFYGKPFLAGTVSNADPRPEHSGPHGRRHPRLRRTPYARSSRNTPSTHSGE